MEEELVVIAVTSLAFPGFVMEKTKLPPSGPIGCQESQNATGEDVINERKTISRKKDNGRISA
ncbi:MAG: hypothetical protein ACYSTT_06505 [Planctomycetota bacterium]